MPSNCLAACTTSDKLYIVVWGCPECENVKDLVLCEVHYLKIFIAQDPVCHIHKIPLEWIEKPL